MDLATFEVSLRTPLNSKEPPMLRTSCDDEKAKNKVRVPLRCRVIIFGTHAGAK